MNIIYDPLNMLPEDVTKYDMQQAIGILLDWARFPSKDVGITMREMYGFPIEPIKDGHISQDGTYNYPQDVPLFPVIQIDHPSQTVYLYRYALVGIVSKDKQEMYRMD